MRNALGILVTLLMYSLGVCAAETGAAPGAAPGGSWKHESELGIAAASGNSSSQTYQAKQLTGYGWDENLVTLGGHYLYGTAKGVEAAKNWDLVGRYERALSDRFSLYATHGWDGDIFVGYEYRTSTGAGGKYYIIPGDKKVDYLAAEAGYRFSYEKHVPSAATASLTSHFLRGYLEGVVGLTEGTTLKASVEALPDLNQTNNFQANFEVALAVAMNRTWSMKAGYTGKFRNTPLVPGNKQYDSLFLVGLLAKL